MRTFVALGGAVVRTQAWGFLGSAHPIAWSRSGGGFSWQFPSPMHQHQAVSAYLKQTDLSPPASSFNSSNRAYPDVSGISADGTSQSSPLVAGVFSMVVRVIMVRVHGILVTLHVAKNAIYFLLS